MTTKTKSLILLGLLSLIWGSYFLLIEIADDYFHPLTIAFVRLAIGGGVLFLALKMQGHHLPKLGRAWAPFVIIGIFEALLTTVFVSIGETHISSALAAILFSTMPIFTVILGYFWLGQSLTRNKVLGVIIGFIGALVIMVPNLSGGTGSGLILLGAFAVLAASLSKAFAALYSHRVLKFEEPIVVAAGMMISAAVIGFPLAVLFGDPGQFNPTLTGVLAMTHLGVLTAGIGIWIFFWLIKHSGPTFAATVRFNEPPIAILLAVFFTGAQLQSSTLLGMLIVLLCIAVMNGYLDGLIGRLRPTT